MKLKQLTIKNIASIEHAEINFDATPLDGERLFLITGDTGSGKSTIIDCLCLVLYGDTPRMNAAQGIEYTNNRSDTLQTNNVKQLLRRGAANAEIILTFNDSQDVPYISTWEVHRAHNKADGNIQSVTRTLSTADGVTPPEHIHNIKKINERISELIGLNMNQFFRTVVLAQGKFSEFLNSDENQKTELLEKMTGTEIYTQMGKRIFLTFREKENIRNNLREQLNNITLLNEDEKKQINEEIVTHTSAQEATFKQGEGAKRMAQWIDEKAKNEKDLDEKQKDLAEKEAKTQEAEFVEKKKLAADWDLTIEPRREWKEQQRAEHQILELKGKKPAMQEEFDNLCAALRATVKALETQRQQLNETEAILKQEEPNREMYNSIKSIKALLKQRNDEQRNVGIFTTALQQDQERQPVVEALVKSTKDDMQRQDDTVKQLEAKYNAINVSGINIQKDALNNAKQAVIQLKAANDAVMQADDRVTSMKSELATEQQTLEKAQATLSDKQTIKEQAQAALDRETDIMHLIEQAHKSLHEGDNCPVCGNTINHLLPPIGEHVIEDLRKRLQSAETDLKNTETNIGASIKAIRQMEQQLAKATDEQGKKSTLRNQQWEATQRLLALCNLPAETLPDNTVADELIIDMDKKTATLNDALRQATDLQNLIKDERNKLTRLTDAHNNAKIDFNKVVESIRHQQEAIKLSTEHVKSLTHDLDALFTMQDWQERLTGDAGFIQGLERRAAEYHDKETSAQRLKESIGKTAALIPAMQDNKRNIVGLTDNGKETDDVPDNLDELWRQFENKCINWNNQLSNEQAKEKQAQQALNQFLSDNPAIGMERLMELNSHQQNEIDGIKRNQQLLADNITLTRGEISSLLKRQHDLTEQKPDFPEENREMLDEICQTSQSKYKELTTMIAELKARLNTDEANQKAVGKKKEELDKAEAVYQQWAEFNEMLGDANGNKFRKIAQSYILGELLHSANYYLSKFDNRYELEAYPGRLIILVRDLQQGDLTSVNTLSGGESFMVSLALALALSGTMGKIFSVDTLFIDEGFGSLSPTYLDNVMETLNRLYDIGGKRVGIISHVEMLKERVTTQIQVYRDPNDNTVSRVKVVS